MVLISYLKKYALVILYKVTSQENLNPLALPSLGTERIMINALHTKSLLNGKGPSKFLKPSLSYW